MSAAIVLAAIAITEAQPTAPPGWTWSGGVHACRLTLTGGAGHLLIGSDPGSGKIYISIDRNGTPEWRKLDDARVSLHPSWNGTADVRTGWGESPGYLQIGVSLPAEMADELAKAVSITVSHRRIGDVDASIPAATAVVDALQRCGDARLREWGIDPAAWRSRPKPAVIGSASDWLSGRDYPLQALRLNIRGVVVAQLTVGTNGRVAACEAINDDADKILASTTCSLLRRRARFQPALDSNSRPVTSQYVTSMRWEFR